MANGLATQDKRLLRLSTVLADDVLHSARISYSEGLGEGFHLSIEAFSEINHDLQAKDLVGTALTLALVDAENEFRYFNGLIQEMKAVPSTVRNNQTQYHLTVVSWMQLLHLPIMAVLIFTRSTPKIATSLGAI